MKNPWVVIVVIVVVLFGGAILYSNISTERNNEGIVIERNIKGNPEAEVKLVEYSDFQCPACASFQPVLEQVMSDYGDQISLEYKHFPLPIHNYAMQAAVAAEAAGQQGKFFEFHDLLFKNQNTWSSASIPNSLFIQYAGELDLDIDQFKRQMSATKLRDRVKDDTSDGRDAKITGTPTFFLNGEKMEFDTFQAFAEQIIREVDPEALTSSSTETGSGVKFGI